MPTVSLWRCLLYVELNMVRCGAVNHPSQSDWAGYHEMMGHRRRYRLLDMDRLLWRLNDPSLEEMRNHLEVGISEAMAKNERKRQAAWTEGLAVGSQGFVEAARGWISSRQETEGTEEENDLWVLQDEEVPYTAKMNAKESSKRPVFNGYFSYHFLFNALLWRHRKIKAD